MKTKLLRKIRERLISVDYRQDYNLATVVYLDEVNDRSLGEIPKNGGVMSLIHYMFGNRFYEKIKELHRKTIRNRNNKHKTNIKYIHSTAPKDSKLMLEVIPEYKIGQHIWIVNTPYRDCDHLGCDEYEIAGVYLADSSNNEEIDVIEENGTEFQTFCIYYILKNVKTGEVEQLNLSGEDGYWGREIHTLKESAMNVLSSYGDCNV